MTSMRSVVADNLQCRLHCVRS